MTTPAKDAKGIARTTGKPNVTPQNKGRGRPALSEEEKKKRAQERAERPDYFTVAPLFIAAGCSLEKIYSTHDRAISVSVLTNKATGDEYLFVERENGMALYKEAVGAKRTMGGFLRLVKELDLEMDMDS